MSEEVRNMFADISGKYDIMNTVLSFGTHYLWRRKAVILSGAEQGMSVLDCASGTGDLAIVFKKAVKDGIVYATDFCDDMLKYAQPKAKRNSVEIRTELADIMNLQYEDDQFDISSVAFGIRNVDDTVIGLSEMARVVKSGGKVVVIEFGQPKGIIAPIYKFYSKYIMPKLGKLIAGNSDAYDYLPKTAAAYPCREEFISLMEQTGRLKNCVFHELMSGIAFIYIGEVI